VPAAPYPNGGVVTRLRSSLLPWRGMRVTVITALTQPVRCVTQLTMVVTRLALTYWLWRALYAGVRVSAGLDVTQAVLGVGG
jgi:hypothetical protein